MPRALKLLILKQFFYFTFFASVSVASASDNSSVEQSLEPLPAPAKIAIIIDDLGYNPKLGMRAINLPGELTISILPFAPNSHSLALAAHQQGKEVMLHAPMSNIHGYPLDQGALTEEMDQAQFIQTLTKSLNAVPHIRGVNNHMGSQLTQASEPMSWLMSVLKERQLYFVDSRTSADSLAWEVAREHDVPSLKRNVFLDHHRNPESIDKQYRRMLTIAKRRGLAIAIAHPYPETLSFLERALLELPENNIQLVRVSELITSQLTVAKQAQAHKPEKAGGT